MSLIPCVIVFVSAAFVGNLLPPHGEKAAVFFDDAAESVNAAELEEAITHLHHMGILDDPEIWMQNTRRGRFTPLLDLQEVFIKSAREYEPVDSIEGALEVLERNKVLVNVKKWNEDFASKDKAPSGVVALALVAIARKVR